MICKYCGKSIPNTAETCPYCGKKTSDGAERNRGGFNWGKFIAIIGSLLVLVSAFHPVMTGGINTLTVSFYASDFKQWVVVGASVVSVIAMIIPKLELLYPLATVFIGFVYAEFIRYGWYLLQVLADLRSAVGREVFRELSKYFTVSYSPFFLAGYSTMIVASVFIVLKVTVGAFFSKR